MQEKESQRGVLENQEKLSWHFGQEHHGKSSILKKESKRKTTISNYKGSVVKIKTKSKCGNNEKKKKKKSKGLN